MSRILIVDDSQNILNIYQQALTREGFLVEVANTAKSGLEMIQKNPPALVILDIMLAGEMNGFDVLEILKRDERLKTIPIIVFTSLDTQKDMALSIGAAEFIIKPEASLTDVVNKVKKHLTVSQPAQN